MVLAHRMPVRAGWRVVGRCAAMAALLLATAACTKGEGSGQATPPTSPEADAPPTAAVEAANADDPRTQANLESIASQLNPDSPMMVDEVTRLDSVAPGTNGRTLRFTYTFVDNAVAAKVAENATLLEQSVRDRMCTGLDMSRVLQDGFELSMEYVDKIGRRVAHFYVDKSQCPGATPSA